MEPGNFPKLQPLQAGLCSLCHLVVVANISLVLQVSSPDFWLLDQGTVNGSL